MLTISQAHPESKPIPKNCGQDGRPEGEGFPRLFSLPRRCWRSFECRHQRVTERAWGNDQEPGPVRTRS